MLTDLRARLKPDWLQAAALALALPLAACGGGGSGGNGGNDDDVIDPPPPTLTGVFLDAEVAGLAYSASPSGLSGTTNADGQFSYRTGDTVSFRLGDIRLGSATGQSTITPRTIAESRTGLPAGVTAADVARNLAILLQTFDEDGNPDNGITIPASVATAAAGKSLDFARPSDEFVEDATLTALAAATGKAVVSPDDAAAHQARSLASQLAGSWSLADDGGFAVFTLFTDGTYVLGLDHVDSNCSDGLEWGRYALDANAGTIATTLTYVDTTGPSGDCGLFEAGQGKTFELALSEDGESLALTFTASPDGDDVGETLTLSRVPAGDGLVGSWLYYQTPTVGYDVPRMEEPIVLTFFPDNRYFMTHVSSGGDLALGSEGTARGIERGTWNVDGNGVLSTTQTVDTNGDGGLSDVGNATVQINANGELELAPEGESPVTFLRLPLAKALDASDLTGTWYAVDAADADPEQGGILTVSFFKDGTYVLGHPVNELDREENEDRSILDYLEFGLDTSTLDPWGAGSEYGRWYLESGLGRLYTGEVSVDSNGSGGFYSRTEELDPRFTHGPADGTGLYLKKLDDNTLELIAYEFEDGAPGETNAGVWSAERFLLKRVVSQPNSLIGSWAAYEDGKVAEVLNLFPNGTLHWVSGHGSQGGVGRSRWQYDAESGTLTETMQADDPYCMDTSEEGVYVLPGECEDDTSQYAVTLSADGRQLRLTEQNEPFEVFEYVKISAP